MKKIIVMGFVVGLAGCGGGGGGGGSSATTPPPATVSPAGLWDGTTSTGREITGIVLDTGEYWVLYSSVGNSSVVGGFAQGNGTSTGNQFNSSNFRDFNFEGSGVLAGTSAATVVFQQSFNGKTTYDATPSQQSTYTTTFNADYNGTPSLAAIAGTYTGEIDGAAGAEFTTVSINSAGTVAASGSSGCNSTGTVKPHATGNVYDVLITFGPSPCALPNQSVSGVGYYSAVDKGLVVGLIDSGRNIGAVFIGAKP